MRLLVIAVGTRMPEWVDTGFETYRKRMQAGARVTLKTIPVTRRARGQSPDLATQQEGRKILAAAPGGASLVALDERGEQLSTRKMAEYLSDWSMDGRDVAFMIGGPDGLSADCLARARQRWSLSRLTLPHGLARVLLAEQLYRAQSINLGHPYHRD